MSALGPHSFVAEDGKEWRVTGLYEVVPGYARIERVEDGAQSLRPIAVLGPDLSLPAQIHSDSEDAQVVKNDASEQVIVSTPATRVVNRKTGEPFDVDVGRPGPWGNPYSHLPGTSATYVVDSREEAVELYRAWLKQRIMAGEPGLVEALADLHDKTLGCYCAPEPCHGDVLAAAAEWAFNTLIAVVQ